MAASYLNLNYTSIMPYLTKKCYLFLTSVLPRLNPYSAGNLEQRFGKHGLQTLGFLFLDSYEVDFWEPPFCIGNLAPAHRKISLDNISIFKCFNFKLLREQSLFAIPPGAATI